MTAKEFVKKEFPEAYAEKFQTYGKKIYYLIWSQIKQDNKIRLAEGHNASKAWINAKKLIQEMKTKNPLI